MLLLSLFFCLTFLIIGFSLNEKNAHYLLSGFNTLSDVEKQAFNLKDFLIFFRKFHLYLSFTLLIASGLNYMYFESEYFLIFLALFPLIAYQYFIYKSSKFYTEKRTKSWKWAILTLGIITVLLSISFAYNLKNNEFVISNQTIEITGAYGEKIEFENIEAIEFDAILPEIDYKINAFALGNNFSKGHFKTKNGKTIKLILNGTDKNIVKIRKKTGEIIYYSSEKKLTEKEIENLNNHIN